MSVPNIPQGYHAVTPHLIIDDVAAAIRFYADAFGASETLRLATGDQIAHAEIRIGDSQIMLAGEYPELDYLSPKARGGCTASLMLYVDDIDAAFRRAIDAGARAERPLKMNFTATGRDVVDPLASWSLARTRRFVAGGTGSRFSEMRRFAPRRSRH